VTRPDFDFEELTEDLSAEEQERLRRVHDLLVEAGAPPQLPSSLRRAPRPGARFAFTVRRPLALALAAALAVAGGSFAVGYVVADDAVDFDRDFVVEMRGAEAAPNASATIDVGERDDAGNWPMVITVRGLRTLPAGGRYLLYLTRNGRPVAWCGSFVVTGETTSALLNAPYRFDRFDGWVVRADLPGRLDTRPYLVSEDIGEA
jgi:hypothetical protein